MAYSQGSHTHPRGFPVCLVPSEARKSRSDKCNMAQKQPHGGVEPNCRFLLLFKTGQVLFAAFKGAPTQIHPQPFGQTETERTRVLSSLVSAFCLKPRRGRHAPVAGGGGHWGLHPIARGRQSPRDGLVPWCQSRVLEQHCGFPARFPLKITPPLVGFTVSMGLEQLTTWVRRFGPFQLSSISKDTDHLGGISFFHTHPHTHFSADETPGPNRHTAGPKRARGFQRDPSFQDVALHGHFIYLFLF